MSRRLTALKARELDRVLRRLGFSPVPKRGKGAHQVYVNAATGRFTTVSWHGGGREVPKGTVKAILQDIEMGWDEFQELL
jgi:predicted RNA binding protein YcfA (HicA-like mRNA interferase family)